MENGNPTLKVEGNIGIALSESIAGIAAIIAAILDCGVGDLQSQGERVSARRNSGHLDPGIVSDDLVALEPCDFRAGISLQKAFHDQFLPFLFDRGLLGEARSFAFRNSISIDIHLDS